MKTKHFLKLIIGLSFGLLLIFGCEKDEENKEPTVSITNPSDGYLISQGDTVIISADADDSDGSISEVRFYVDGTGVGTATSFPYDYEWIASGISGGNHLIEVTAYDDEGATNSDNIIVDALGPDDVLNPTTGKIWMNRNLGASQVATSIDDAASYGDLYQWGREADGHELRTSSTTTSLSNNDNPGHSAFIVNPVSPHDWRIGQNDSLWQGVSGKNNPCPSGYRLATEAEWTAERASWNTDDAAGAFASPLKIPTAGYRYSKNGYIDDVGLHAFYWTSTVDGIYAHGIRMRTGDVSMRSANRARGYSVRCIRD